MKHKLSIIYSWFIRLILLWAPNYPPVRRFRGFLYSLMMRECGKNFQVNANTNITTLVGLRVGDNVRIAHNVVITGDDIDIGNNVIIGPNTVLSSGIHQFDGVAFNKLKSKQVNIIIEDGCWIGANCTIVAGARLPQKSILAAGAVLIRKFDQAKGIYGGIPAKLIKLHSE